MEILDQGQQAVVIGGGATGSWAAYKLTRAGVRVLLLEAGGTQRAGAMPAVPIQAPLDSQEERSRLRATRALRGRQRVQRGCYAFNPRTAPLFVSDTAQPYAAPADSPYRWIRVRASGGRTLVWNGIASRMGPEDFRLCSADASWPFAPADLTRHYDEVESVLTRRVAPGLPPAVGEPPGAAIRRRLEQGWPQRSFELPPHFHSPDPDAAGSRWKALPQHSCRSALALASRTGLLTTRTGAAVARLGLAPGGARVEAAEVVDADSGVRLRVPGRAFVLGASTLESTRVLLNSGGEGHESGLGNGSGLLGRFLSDHLVGVSLLGISRDLARGAIVSGPAEVYVAPFRNMTDAAEGFGGTYGIQVYADGQRCALHAFGTVAPRRENRVQIHRSLEDEHGIPSLHIRMRYGDEEIAMARDQAIELGAIADALGYRVVQLETEPAVPGTSMHEVGTARMAARPEDGVLDPRNRVWGTDNAFVVDGACFPSMGAGNPTLTMLAITGRACEEIAARLAAGSL